MDNFKENTKIKEALGQYQPDFHPFFETRLMSKITVLGEQDFNHLFDRAFLRVVLPSIAALVALVITIGTMSGTMTPDSLMGTSNLDLETLTAMTISGY